MKTYWEIVSTIIIGLIVALFFTINNVKTIEEERDNMVENYKYYSNLFNASEVNNRALKLTVDQLKYSNDSILQKLNETKEQLRIKDANVKSMQYVASSFSKKDTIVFTDTLFRDQQVSIDTTLFDKWYSVRVGMLYPSAITICPEFRSEKHIIVSTRKETVNPPYRFFLFRLFQKKHTVLNIDVIEKNPYISNQNTRYIEVIK